MLRSSSGSLRCGAAWLGLCFPRPVPSRRASLATAKQSMNSTACLTATGTIPSRPGLLATCTPASAEDHLRKSLRDSASPCASGRGRPCGRRHGARAPCSARGMRQGGYRWSAGALRRCRRCRRRHPERRDSAHFAPHRQRAGRAPASRGPGGGQDSDGGESGHGGSADPAGSAQPVPQPVPQPGHCPAAALAATPSIAAGSRLCGRKPRLRDWPHATTCDQYVARRGTWYRGSDSFPPLDRRFFPLDRPEPQHQLRHNAGRQLPAPY